MYNNVRNYDEYNCNIANNSNRVEFRQLISYRATQNPHFPLCIFARRQNKIVLFAKITIYCYSVPWFFAVFSTVSLGVHSILSLDATCLLEGDK